MAEALSSVSFADVAHQTLIFDREDEADRLVLELADTKWMQRLRSVRQTGHTNLVYMFSEHSRFGHCLGVAYLALSLMKKLERSSPEQIAPWKCAVAAAAILHDVGHVAPGSHLGERIWATGGPASHEDVSIRVIEEDEEILAILGKRSADLPRLVGRILRGDPELPPWTTAIISGGGWNADRGNWAIVDSAMCSVSYGRYNVTALIDAFCLTADGELALRESRLDALTHFFVARDSMYRQVYQHRVLQVADVLAELLVRRLREIGGSNDAAALRGALHDSGIFADETMIEVLASRNYAVEIPLASIFRMTESWWRYHLEEWCFAPEEIIKDLAVRLRDRKLLKTIRYDRREQGATDLHSRAVNAAKELGFDPSYYVTLVENADRHRGKREAAPLVVLDSGQVVPVTQAEPIIAKILEQPEIPRQWLAVPKEVKEKLGKKR